LGFAGFESRELNAAFMTKRRRVASETLHIVDRNLDLLSALGLARQPAAFPLPAFSPSSALAQLLAMTFPAGRFAVINPGATWCTKRWPVSRFSGLARRLAADLDLRSWVLWGNDRERADAQQLVADAGGAALLAPPTDLDDMAALIASSQLFVGNDTGPMHLACALGTPTVAVFGASDIRRNGPYSSNSLGLVALEPPACQPCQKTSCQRGDLACLEGVDEARVFWACRELLSRRPAPDALAPSGEAHAAV
jgi:ADP-heptose:LPS heptosyltransferase